MYDQVTLGLNVDPFILSALKEDITSEDVSTNSVMPHPQAGEVDLICKQDGIICGLQVFERVFTLLDADTKVEFYVKDGDRVENKQLIGKVYGDIRVLLCGERTALNYLQRMSGIATYTSQVAALLEGTGIKLLDTRKTTPNNRIFEKYSVRVGGGNNHRYNLSDGVLLKDNHIGAAGGVKEAIAMAKAYAPFVRKIEVEVESFDMVKDAVEAGVTTNDPSKTFVFTGVNPDSATAKASDNIVYMGKTDLTITGVKVEVEQELLKAPVVKKTADNTITVTFNTDVCKTGPAALTATEVTFTNASPLPAGVSAATAVVTHSTTEKANVVTITLNRALVDGDKVGITTGVLNAGNTTDTAAAATFTYNATTGLFTTP